MVWKKVKDGLKNVQNIRMVGRNVRKVRIVLGTVYQTVVRAPLLVRKQFLLAKVLNKESNHKTYRNFKK
jgi:hypothetical protein